MTEKEIRSDQIELKLYQKQEELTTARARYFGLYDLAQVGYCIISEEGLILETNLTAASLLGVARGALVKQLISSFILKKNQNIYYLCLKQLLKPGTPQTCEMRMVKIKEQHSWCGMLRWRLFCHFATKSCSGPGTMAFIAKK